MKILQIATATLPGTEMTRQMDCLYALCENGQVACMDFGSDNPKWLAIQEVPDNLFG